MSRGEMAGFSPRNLKYMRKFAATWPDAEIVQRTVALIPWRTNLTLLDSPRSPTQRYRLTVKGLKLKGDAK